MNLYVLVGRVFIGGIIMASMGLSAVARDDISIISDSLEVYRDFPKVGVDFFDISGTLKNPHAFSLVIDNLVAQYKDKKIDAILALDARGFLFATPLSYKLKIPVVMLRKPGKLPGDTYDVTYTKEYGDDIIEMKKDALEPGARVIIVDDLLATGGTMKAAIKLARSAKANVIEVATIIELLEFEQTRDLDVPVYSVVKK